jgi:quercetin dioxygenase-like cupin family protein
MQDVYQGNAFEDGKDTRGWIVGDFLPAWTGLHKTDKVEMKWSHLQAGAKRDGWVTGETRTTLGIIVSGSFRYQFRDKSITLSNQGDYVMWGPGVDHSWEAVTDCLVITIRWPSIADLQEAEVNGEAS